MSADTIPTKLDLSTFARLTALAGATFVYVTFEVFPLGLIQDIARGVDVTAGQVGLLVSGYAIIAAIATIPTAALQVPRSGECTRKLSVCTTKRCSR